MGTISVFVSWSGAASVRVAGILRETLPSIVNAINPWTSEEIEKGENWHARLTDAVSHARAAIVCVTPSNVLAPWIYFEAGAIWSLGHSVCPYLVGLPKNALAGTPLSHLQATDALNEQDSLRLCMKLNDIGGNLITETVLKRSFAMWWPTWKDQLAAIPANPTMAEIPIAKERVGTEARTQVAPPMKERGRRKSVDVRAGVLLRDRRLTRSDYEKVFLKLISGDQLRIGDDMYTPVGMKGWYHAIFRRTTDGAEKLLTIDQLLSKLSDWAGEPPITLSAEKTEAKGEQRAKRQQANSSSAQTPQLQPSDSSERSGSVSVKGVKSVSAPDGEPHAR